MAAIAAWRKRHRQIDLSDQMAMAASLFYLRDRLERLSEKHIRQFYKMGRNKRRLDMADAVVLAAILQRNSTFINGSLIPYIQNELIGTDIEGTIGDLAEERESSWQSRAGLYAGAAWAARWLGLQESVREVSWGREKPQRVRRVLDPMAAHCDTCPPKAREYESWDDMLARCGGLPADGSDRCHSNCRCLIEVEVAPGYWDQVI